MGTLATTLISRFFKRRDESVGEVFTTAEAVDLLNEAQHELAMLELVQKSLSFTFDASAYDEYSLPNDYMSMGYNGVNVAGEKVTFIDEADLSSRYPEWQSESSSDETAFAFIRRSTAGKLKLRLFPDLSTDQTVDFTYIAMPTDIPDAPTTEYVMNGLSIPGVDRFLLYRMLEASAYNDEEIDLADRFARRAESALQEIMTWKNLSHGNEMQGIMTDMSMLNEYMDDY